MECRFTDQDTDIGRFRVKKGTFVYVLFHSLHNSPAYWDEPSAFQPERWIEKGAQYAKPVWIGSTGAQQSMAAHVSDETCEKHKRFLPFSNGPRSCVAQVLSDHHPDASVLAMQPPIDIRMAECVA